TGSPAASGRVEFVGVGGGALSLSPGTVLPAGLRGLLSSRPPVSAIRLDAVPARGLVPAPTACVVAGNHRRGVGTGAATRRAHADQASRPGRGCRGHAERGAAVSRTGYGDAGQRR